MIEFNDAPFVPCNDCANWESCQEEAYKQGKADGYSQAENDYHTQTEKDRQSSYDCGYQQGKADEVREFAEWLQYGQHDFCVVDYDNRLETVPFEIILAEWQKGEENE